MLQRFLIQLLRAAAVHRDRSFRNLPYQIKYFRRQLVKLSPKVMMWVMLLLPWISLIYMKKGGVKRDMPVALFAAM
jgi:hypothetical protein